MVAAPGGTPTLDRGACRLRAGEVAEGVDAQPQPGLDMGGRQGGQVGVGVAQIRQVQLPRPRRPQPRAGHPAGRGPPPRPAHCRPRPRARRQQQDPHRPRGRAGPLLPDYGEIAGTRMDRRLTVFRRPAAAACRCPAGAQLRLPLRAAGPAAPTCAPPSIGASRRVAAAAGPDAHPSEAVRALTVTAAASLGAPGGRGLALGQTADLAACDGDPFEPDTRVVFGHKTSRGLVRSPTNAGAGPGGATSPDRTPSGYCCAVSHTPASAAASPTVHPGGPRPRPSTRPGSRTCPPRTTHWWSSRSSR
jgi:hypothetical protein